jgi:WD40 repeat protein
VVWDVEAGAEVARLAGAQPVRAVAFQPDGRRLAIGYGRLKGGYWVDGELRLWDLHSLTWTTPVAGSPGGALALAYGLDGRLAAVFGNPQYTGPEGDVLRVFDATTGAEVRESVPLPYPAAALVYSPDGRRLVTSTSREQTVKVRDAESGLEVLTLQGLRRSIMGLAFSPDGTRLAGVTGNWNGPREPGQVLVWDAPGFSPPGPEAP